MSESSNTGAHEHTIKETIISLLISFVMALVFRSYVVEAFVIPTGSMAPTLMGKHTLHRSEHTGYEWAMNPTYFHDAGQQIPLPIQGGAFGKGAISATDPMTTNGFTPSSISTPRRDGLSTTDTSKPLLAGDRILVQKYLYEVFPPTRYDVVVFKNPTNPLQNYIKRLIGLPNEQVLITEGDIFARPLDDAGEPTRGAYEIQRKPVRIMADLWRPLFSSEYTPRTESPAFRFPWMTGAGWSREGGTLTHDGSSPTTLAWDTVNWPIWDWEPYNESVVGVNNRKHSPLYPVGDVRARAGVEPTGEGLDLSCSVATREHEFRASIIGTGATLAMRRAGTGITPGEWTTLASEQIRALPAGRVSNVEFWHYDQRLILRVDGKAVAEAEYDWDASERLLNTTGEPIESYERAGRQDRRLVAAQTYTRASANVAWSFSGGGVTLHRVGLDRDIYHRPMNLQHSRDLGHGTHPLTAIKLNGDQFWCLGDNSPASLDGRAWDDVEHRVAETIDDTPGVVPRKLMLGKAFFVYFPAIHKVFDKIPIPNAGKLRLIR